MRDAITGLIGRYDQLGRYFDRNAVDSIEAYLSESALRIKAVELINSEATEIVREASQRLFAGDPELLLPGGNAYTTRRLAACLRDMDYFLRYASYALVAGDSTILNERVLNGLAEKPTQSRLTAGEFRDALQRAEGVLLQRLRTLVSPSPAAMWSNG